jgi:hypothetical protein
MSLLKNHMNFPICYYHIIYVLLVVDILFVRWTFHMQPLIMLFLDAFTDAQCYDGSDGKKIFYDQGPMLPLLDQLGRLTRGELNFKASLFIPNSQISSPHSLLRHRTASLLLLLAAAAILRLTVSHFSVLDPAAPRPQSRRPGYLPRWREASHSGK